MPDLTFNLRKIDWPPQHESWQRRTDAPIGGSKRSCRFGVRVTAQTISTGVPALEDGASSTVQTLPVDLGREERVPVGQERKIHIAICELDHQVAPFLNEFIIRVQPKRAYAALTCRLKSSGRSGPGLIRQLGTSRTNQTRLQGELTEILAALPEAPVAELAASSLARWATWLGHEPREALPPLRLILVWDNLAGHLSWPMVRWLFRNGVLPLYTPLSGSWLNMTVESLQRIIVRRALAGQEPQSAQEVIQWLEDTVEGWNAAPTPFEWDGKRRERRQRACQRRLGGSPALLADHQLIAG